MEVDITTENSHHQKSEKQEIQSSFQALKYQSILRRKSTYRINNFQALMNTLTQIRSLPDRELPPDLVRLRTMSPAIYDLDAMVGQTEAKEHLLRLILFCAQNLYQRSSEMMNVCIYAPPGSGKTKLTQIIADIFYYSGLLTKTEANTKERFVRGTRATLISGFLGQTAICTQKVINQCIAEQKCLLIDEAYALNNPDRKDSFSKECLDTLNQNLSEFPTRFRVIIAGYRKETEECFFKTNQGLARRFGFTYELTPYKPSELREIFFQQLSKCGYDVENIWLVATESWFAKHLHEFVFAGGDIENLSKFARLRSAQRCFGLPHILKNRIKSCDLRLGLADLKENRIHNEEDLIAPESMYM